ncbi:MAG: phosphotransferase, partial [Thermotogota bacterium]|nr:phosphotransferase [Thermotogota bacterium]
NPREYQKLKPVYDQLSSDFFKHYEIIPNSFCHGDYHPLNILWNIDSIRAVIDWEFLGEKIEIYDMANLLGCIGIEEPLGLVNDLALTFIKRLKDSEIISEIGFHYLLDCVMAIRFAWLAEWFRHFDQDMIQLEIDFLHLLDKNKLLIKEKWDKV